MHSPLLLDFTTFYELFFKAFDTLGFEASAHWMSYTAAGISLSFIAINLLILSTALYTWFERRTIARFQVRRGPNRNGPYGLLQPFADVIKLIMKEDTIPESADKVVFTLAPIVLLAPTLLIITVIPMDDSTFLGTLNIGILFIVGITSVNSIAIFMAGWGSRNKYAILGSMRGAAMLVSYEIPMALGITSVLLLSGSLAMKTIADSQLIWFILVMPLGFFVFMAAAMAEMSRTPFDQIESESELGSGYNTEFSGIKFAILFLAEFMAPIVTSAVVTTLFLGGNQGFSPIPGPIWFILKMFVVIFILLWIRSTWPRLRIDQIMGFAWKPLFGLGIINIFLIALESQILMEEGKLSQNDMLIMSGINWVLTIVGLLVMFNIYGRKRYNRPDPIPSQLANMGTDLQ
jgi:NADH-quinone oxidoreductase subunit H